MLNKIKKFLPVPVNVFIREINKVLSEINKIFAELLGYRKEILVVTEELNKRNDDLKKAIRQVHDDLQLLKSKNSEFEDDLQLLKSKNSEFEKELKKISYTSDKAYRYASEAGWSDIFNSTIKDTTWLLDTTFSPGRWAVGYSFLYVMYRVLNESKPKSILEIGLGQSTKMIAQYVKANPEVQHIVVEQDEEWVQFFKNNYEIPSSSEIYHLPVKEVEFLDDDKTMVYDGFTELLECKKFDLIIVDAPSPSRSTKYRRVDIYNIVPQALGESFVIIFDDINNGIASAGYNKILQKIEDCGVEFVSGNYYSTKDLKVVTTPNQKYLCTL